MSGLRGQEGRGKRTSRRRLAAALGLAVGIALIPTLALAHVERASYWPLAGTDTADGVPTGGQVPAARSLFSALDPAAGETRVVCQGGQSLPYRPAAAIGKRTPLEVSRDRVDRLKRKLKRVHKKKKSKKKKKKVRRIKRKLKRAKAGYRAALAAEQAARQKGEGDYQQASAAEQAAQRQYQAQLAQQPSMQALDASIANARQNGYVVRPSEGPVFETVGGNPVGPGQQWGAYLAQLRDFNAQLLARCQYTSIQAAVNDSGNNDRVVVMPGTYTEDESRAVDEDPAAADNPCDGLQEQNDRGNTGALSYRYQFHCPNQQNLIAIMGREPDKDATNGDANGEEVPPPPDPDDPRRGGIPDADGLPDGGGDCIRCNLQLEGSGVSPDDVVVDSGRVESGNGAPMDSQKDVGIRADRADGFVLRNMTVRHAEEHDIYVPETDGLLLERFKTFFNGEYGVLTFVAQHHLIQDCDAAGSGDAAIYPGSSAEAGEQVDPNFDADGVPPPSPDHTESNVFSTEIRRCDMHHSSTGYSGTAGNSVFIHDNDFYDNAMGLVTDVFTAAGHPGFPQDSDLIENNEFYSNNFNPYVEDASGNLNICDSANGENPGDHGPDQGCTDVVPRIPAPVGTAMFLPGVNNNTIRNNHMWDNWRRGTMLFAVPDSLVCGPATAEPPDKPANEQHGCDETEFNTSHRNEQHDNVMGRSPDHTPDPTWPGSGSNAADPNGTDFWWDAFTGNAKNCWYDNTGPEADGSGVTSTPPATLLPGEGVQDCATSLGNSAAQAFGQEAELGNCLGDYTFDTGTCDWFVTPDPEPQPD